MITLSIILAVVITASFFIIRNLIVKNERLEDFISKQSEAITACDKRLKEIDDKGILVDKKFYDKDDMQKISFDKDITTVTYSKNSFIYNFLYSLRQKIDDPLGKKRIKD